MQKCIRTLALILIAMLSAACHLAYTPDLQQGNIFSNPIDRKVVNQLKPGLTRQQVLALLGTPSVTSPFDHSRWDYISTYSHRGGKTQKNAMSLYFNHNTLVRIKGSPFANTTRKIMQQNRKYQVGYPINETEGDKSQSPNNSQVTGIDGHNKLTGNR